MDYIDGQTTASGGDRGVRGKVDYKEVLSPEGFTVFSKLRDLRKEIAQAEAVPVYTIFTNEQLAQMVKARATTKADMEKIAGLGDARIEKYGTWSHYWLIPGWHRQRGADRQPDLAAPGEFLPRLVRPIHQGTPAVHRICSVHGRHGSVG
jgi:hypothetical protein